MLNSDEIKNKVSHDSGRAATLMKAMKSDEENILELYLRAFSRHPSPEELRFALDYLSEPVLGNDGKPIDESNARRRNLEDFVWALMNTKEFLFNH